MDNQLNRYEKTIYSQFGEDGIIEEIFNRIGTTNRFCVEFGAYDGITLSNSANLIINKGWTSFMIEGDTLRYHQALNNYQNLGIIDRVTIVNSYITQANIANIFQTFNVPHEFDYMCIDIDGNDYWIWKALDEYRPRVLTIEYRGDFLPPTEWI